MQIPVLLYHRLLKRDESNSEKYEIPVEQFERHIDYLSKNGYEAILFDDIFRKGNDFSNDRKCVIITFDDGSYSDYSIAFPILRKYGLLATFFVTVNWIGTENYVQWPNLEVMNTNKMSVQSHGLSHSFLSDLSIEKLNKELNESKKIIESKLNTDVNFISIPGGFFSRRVLAAARDVGYRGACTSSPGLIRTGLEGEKFRVFNRFVITRATSFRQFMAIIAGDYTYVAKCKAEYGLKTAFKKLLGSKRYYNVWSKYFRKV